MFTLTVHSSRSYNDESVGKVERGILNYLKILDISFPRANILENASKKRKLSSFIGKYLNMPMFLRSASSWTTVEKIKTSVGFESIHCLLYVFSLKRLVLRSKLLGRHK